MNDETPDEVDPIAEGFGEPPDYVTEPCLTYMARIMELREFVSFYFSFVKTSHKIGEAMPVSVRERAGTEELKLFEYNYSKHRQLVNQIMLSRATESFDLYLTTVLRDIFLSRPEMLKSEGTIDIAAIIESGSYEDVIWQIVERKVHELSYKSLRELRKFIKTRTGIDIFPSEEAFETVVVASEVRNLIAHNDCVVNDLFLARTKEIELPLNVSETSRIQITDTWLRRASYTMDGLVFRFDQLASEKFELRTLFRMGAVILRS
ncbi:hypothetical protein [Ruegeria sp. YS9]|uniref:hypothetical protein n=1 Tax=Ruegeria sp. YS9 TaxID=2966453 RepID=UPI00214CFEAC|nr:hypothetical protein [Ruegeria sp. YS9]UUV06467.1 hypothetical protein NOR97_01575 [Ruegeria sp. YS9]